MMKHTFHSPDTNFTKEFTMEEHIIGALEGSQGKRREAGFTLRHWSLQELDIPPQKK